MFPTPCLQASLESGAGGAGSLEGANAHDVAALLKQFLRELPEALLTRRLAAAMEACVERRRGEGQGSESAAALLALACLLLPDAHLQVSGAHGWWL